MPREKSAGAVIFRKSEEGIKYLILHYQSGHWDFAKGHIEPGESEEETVKREIQEETGISDLRIIPGYKESIRYFFRSTYDFKGEEKSKAPWIFKMVVFYLAETSTQEIRISHEHIGYKWLDYESARKQVTHKNAKLILDKARQKISELKTP